VDNTNTHSFDLVVIGAGSGGYAAGRTARDLGASVAFVDKGPLGGLCILRGCMPSKTLIATGDAAYEIRHAGELGVHAGEPAIDFAAVMARKREIIAGFADYRIAGIDTFPVFHGEARFESPHRLRVGDDVVLEAKNFVIGTGSTIAPAVIPGLAEAGFIDSDAALERAEPPKSLVVLGGGYVGSELTQFYARIGVPATILIRSNHLLSGEDTDIGEALTEYFREEGIAVETHAAVQRVSVRDDGMKVVHYLQDGVEKSVAAHEIFYALGRVPNVAALDLAAAGVEYHNVLGVTVDETMRTSQPHIFAVGDVTGRFLLVHVAIQQGEVAARNAIHGAHEAIDYRLSRTHTVFTDPQVAVVGDSEKDLQRAGVAYVVASAPFNDHGKAIAIGKTKGFVKMMASPLDGRILGCAILGPDASDLIHEMIVAMNYNATVFEFMRIPHLHPTMAEILTYPAEELAAQITSSRPLAIAQ
jgi:pyruvate/2-oxoglutarate dehydrogenase complex dihydrolipoamide dehydrogenase (E3) component